MKTIVKSILALALSAAALSAEVVEYNKADFEKAQIEGKTVVLDVAAWWCPVCRIQKSRLSSMIEDEPEFKNVPLFVVSNSDDETKLAHNINSRGTLIAFKGKAEKSRLVLETDKEKLRALIRSGL